MASIAPEMHAIQGSLHNQVYLGLKPLMTIMKMHGLFPIANNLFQNLNNISKKGLGLIWLFLITVSVCGVTAVWYGVTFDYAVYIADPVESIVLIINTALTCLVSLINLFAMVAQGPHWAAYFKQWKRLDSSLGFTMDAQFRSYVKKLSIAYCFYVSAAFGSMMYAVVQKFLSPDEDYTGNGVVVGFLTYSIIINGCQLLPEILFSCLVSAISQRFSILIEKIQHIVDSAERGFEQLEIQHELEKSRIAFHCLMEIVKSTDSFVGPVLASCVFVSTAYLSSTFFFVFFQSLDNPGLISSKLVYSSVALFRLMHICFSADASNRLMKKLKRVVYLIPSHSSSISEESFHELMLFVQCTRKVSVSFTAWKFFAIDKELFNKLVGAILTYTITILEFYGKNNS